MIDYNDSIGLNRQLILATMVLSGVITEEQLKKLIESGEEPPRTWQEIITRIRGLQND